MPTVIVHPHFSHNPTLRHCPKDYLIKLTTISKCQVKREGRTIKRGPPTAEHTHRGNQNWKRDTCTPMFITALFTIASIWKQPRCPSADEWVRKLWYIYTMEYYSAIKKNSSNWISSNEVHETGAYYTEWSKSEKKPIQYINAYIWNLEIW